MEIAKSYRKKVAEQINESQISTFDWLTAAGNKDSWREGAKILLQTEELKECTFRPNIKPSTESQMSVRRSSRGTSRDILSTSVEKCAQLYQRAK